VCAAWPRAGGRPSSSRRGAASWPEQYSARPRRLGRGSLSECQGTLRARETGVPSALARRKTTAPEATGCASSTFFSLKEQRNVKQQPYGRSTETKNARTRPRGNKQTNGAPQLDLTLKSSNNRPVCLAYQPPTNSTFLSKQISQQYFSLKTNQHQ
jgi:hypothetical protein